MGGQLFDVQAINGSPALVVATLVWLFALGGVVGSFLNVVVHRLPRRESLLYPASRCPACKTPIRWHDNVPMLGWLVLRGRCRDCQAAIPARYPLVEAATGAIFALLGWLEVLNGSLNSPWGIYAYHLLLVCTLLCAALIEHDGHWVPWRLMPMMLILGLALQVIWPELRPAPSGIPLLERFDDQWGLIALIDGLVGPSTGIVLGLLMWPAMVFGPAGQGGRWSALAALILVGSYLGCQAAIGIGLVAAALHLITSCAAWGWPGSGRMGFCMLLLASTLAWIVFSSAIGQWQPWLFAKLDIEALAATVAIAVFAVATYFVRSSLPLPAPNPTAPQSIAR